MLSLKHIVLSTVAALFAAASSLAQEPGGGEVPVVFDKAPAPMFEGGDPAGNTGVPGAGDPDGDGEPLLPPATEVIDGQVLQPGQTPEFNQQIPGYESESDRRPARDVLPTRDSIGDVTQDLIPVMTRREAREQRRKLKDQPLQLPELSRDGFRVVGGSRIAVTPKDSTAGKDSLKMREGLALAGRRLSGADSTLVMAGGVPGDTTSLLTGTIEGAPDPTQLTARERRMIERARRRTDTMFYRHTPLFRDTIPISGLTALSFVAPGFSQVYNGDYWKVPVLYAAAGTSLVLGISENRKYRGYKQEYDYLMSREDTRTNRAMLDPIQSRLIKHNTLRQLAFAGAMGSYLYFIGDGVLNYPGQATNVKIATTLSTIFPGAGQFYNKSYWKAPIVLGGFATFVYIIDWNNRGYQRYATAEKLRTDGDPGTVDEFSRMGISDTDLQNYKRAFRRNRDMAIILTAAFYFLNVMDAHVDAHLQDYDISDDLGFRMRLEPSVNSLYTMASGNRHVLGMSLNITF